MRQLTIQTLIYYLGYCGARKVFPKIMPQMFLKYGFHYSLTWDIIFVRYIVTLSKPFIKVSLVLAFSLASEL